MSKQQQVKQHSGNLIHPNLDEYSRFSLIVAQDEHKKRGGNFSQSVLVRRALRFYGEHLKNMTPDGYKYELIESTRAAKGVL